MKRIDVQVLDPSGVLLGGAISEPVQSQRLALEQDLVRRVLAVLTPWLGQDRVSVQVTATLQDSETRQTVEQVRNIVVAGQKRPLEKAVRTTSVPEGSIQRINATVILGFEATASERWKAEQMARQALGYQSARGDTVNVYALPSATLAKPETIAPQVQMQSPPTLPAAISIPQVQPHPEIQREFPLGWIAAGAGVLLLLALGWRRVRRTEAPDLVMDDFNGDLDLTRHQVMADPRVTADVIKLWMRA